MMKLVSLTSLALALTSSLALAQASAGGLVNLAWELSYEIADLSRTLRPDEGTKGE